MGTRNDIDLAALDFGAVTPREFARIVRDTPTGKAHAFLAGPHRRRVLDEIFRRMEILFKPDAAGDREALVRWRITGSGDTVDTYETYIGGGRCAVTARATDRAARLTLTMAAPALLGLASGNASGPVLFLTRKLRLHGDLRLAGGLLRFFDIPHP